MKVRRLVIGFAVAVVLAVMLEKTAEAFYMPCVDLFWGFDTCWPF